MGDEDYFRSEMIIYERMYSYAKLLLKQEREKASWWSDLEEHVRYDRVLKIRERVKGDL